MSFGKFLETRQRLRKASTQQRPVEEERPEETLAPELPVYAFIPLALVEEGGTPVPELLAQTGMELGRFSEALNELERAGLISLQTENGRQVAALTEKGAALKKTSEQP